MVWAAAWNACCSSSTRRRRAGLLPDRGRPQAKLSNSAVPTFRPSASPPPSGVRYDPRSAPRGPPPSVELSVTARRVRCDGRRVRWLRCACRLAGVRRGHAAWLCTGCFARPGVAHSNLSRQWKRKKGSSEVRRRKTGISRLEWIEGRGGRNRKTEEQRQRQFEARGSLNGKAA